MASAPCRLQRIPERSILSLIRFLHAPSTQPLAIGNPCCRYSSYFIYFRLPLRYLPTFSTVLPFSPFTPRLVALCRIPLITWLTFPCKTRNVCLRAHAVASSLPSG